MNNKQLIKKLENAYVVCRDCGNKYGVYSVGCSSVYEGKCDVCEQTKPITEARDYAYLVTGIRRLKLADKEKIKEQSTKITSSHECKSTLTQEPIMTDDELDGIMVASYEEGEITCKFTEAEVTALAEVLNAHEEEHPPGRDVDYDSAFEKVMELYGDNCVKYELSPAMKKYHELYGTFGFDNEMDTARWEGFRAGFREGEEG